MIYVQKVYIFAMTSPVLYLQRDQWNTLHAFLNWICQYHHGTGVEETNSYSPHFIAIWVLSGKVRISINSKLSWTEGNAGDWLFQQPNRSVTYMIQANTTFISIGFSIARHDAATSIRPPRQLLWKSSGHPELEKKTEVLHQTTLIREKQRKDLQSLYIETNMETHFLYTHLFYDWLATWIRSMDDIGLHWLPANKTPPIVVDTIQRMEQHKADQPFSLPELAQKAGVSIRQLTRLFQQSYEVSPKEYWMKMKLQKAIHNLQTTTDHIDTIATRFACKPVWFYRWIKKETGMTPLQLRRNTTFCLAEKSM